MENNYIIVFLLIFIICIILYDIYNRNYIIDKINLYNDNLNHLKLDINNKFNKINLNKTHNIQNKIKNKEKNNITKQSNKQQQINKNLDNLIIDDINSDINDIDTINSTFNKKIYDNNSLSDIDII
jgi:preprotein translocase subunit SecF